MTNTRGSRGPTATGRVGAGWQTLWAGVVCGTLLAGCASEVSGPKPAIDAPAGKKLAVEPAVVCSDQLTTVITLHGQHLSPVAIDVPQDPRVALPNVTLLRAHELDGSKGDAAEILFSGDPDDATNLSLLAWKSQEEMQLTLNQQVSQDGKAGAIPEGVYDVRVENPTDGQDTELGSLAVVRKPALELATPSIVCLDEEARTLVLTGTTFVEIEGKQPTFEVDGLKDPIAVSKLEACTKIAHDGVKSQTCKKATIELEKGAVPAGYHAIKLRNPQSAACSTEEKTNLRVVKAPVITQVVPALACVAQEERALTIEGTGFLEIDATPPTVNIGGKSFAASVIEDTCDDLATVGHKVRLCTSLSVTVGKAELSSGQPEVVVQNPAPAGCSASNAVALTIVPPPSIAELVPALVCLDDGARMIEVEGQDFLTVDGVVPSIDLGGVVLNASSIAATNCEDLAVDGLKVERCATLVLTLAPGEVPDGTPSIKVTNPDPAGCEATANDLLTIVPGPTLTSAAPALVCADDAARDIVLTGTGFMTVDGALPEVTFNTLPVTVKSVANCSPIGPSGAGFESCTTITVTVAQGALAAGGVAIAVQNPAPAGCAAASNTLLVSPPVLAISGADPSNFCQGASGVQAITLRGTGFLVVDGAVPGITVGTTSLALTAGNFTECTDLGAVPGFTSVKSCNAVALTYDVTGLTVSDIPVSVTSPVPAGTLLCNESAASVLRIVAPPTVTDVSPDDLCSDIEEQLTITGSSFAQGAEVLVGNDCDAVAPVDCTEAFNVVVSQDGTTITATFPGLPPGTFDVTVRNAASCEGSWNQQVAVHPTPLVFFVDPPVAYSDISIEATIFTSGLGGTSLVDTVEIINASDVATALTASTPVGKPNRIEATIPSALAAGLYDVRVTSSLGCVGTLSDGLEITDQLDLTLASISPPYVSSTEATPVTIKASAGTFVAVPRVYLNPSSGSTNASALRAVNVVDGTTITAVIPGSLTVGVYDLIVVNPSGEVGFLADAVTVTAGEPPVIATIVPASLRANSSADATITLTGEGFVTGATVAFDCVLSNGTTHVTIPEVAATVTGGGTTATALIKTNTGTPSPPDAGSICVARLTNPDDAYADYSAVSITNSSLNIADWSNGSTLNTARRGLVAIAARPTGSNRYLYAIGGDSGVTGNPHGRGTLVPTVEAASVDLFAQMGPFAVQRNDLSSVVIGGVKTSAPRTQPGVAQVGRFVYVVGGHNGTAAQDTLLRAEVLDPLATPEIDDLDARLGDADEASPTEPGLGSGLWLYRVAALFPADDENNPGGESVGGEMLNAQLPDNPRGIILSLNWTPVVGASGYRIYRTPTAGGIASSARLLAAVDCGGLCNCATTPSQCRIEDTNDGFLDAQESPLPVGSLGVWHKVETATGCGSANCSLGTPREGLSVAAVRDRTELSTTTDTYYLYAIGGRDGTGTYLNTYEMAKVTVTLATSGTPETHTIEDFTAGADALRSARADLGTWVVNADTSSLIRGSGTPDDIWLYYGGGRSDDATADRTIEAALVGANGVLGSWIAQSPVDNVQGSLVGFAPGVANNQLYCFGGDSSASASSTVLCDGTGNCDPLPDLKNPSSLAYAAIDRMYSGYAQESAFFFLVGGHGGTSSGDVALSTTENTVQ